MADKYEGSTKGLARIATLWLRNTGKPETESLTLPEIGCGGFSKRYNTNAERE
jgi:hypothetical protein